MSNGQQSDKKILHKPESKFEFHPVAQQVNPLSVKQGIVYVRFRTLVKAVFYIGEDSAHLVPALEHADVAEIPQQGVHCSAPLLLSAETECPYIPSCQRCKGFPFKVDTSPVPVRLRLERRVLYDCRVFRNGHKQPPEFIVLPCLFPHAIQHPFQHYAVPVRSCGHPVFDPDCLLGYVRAFLPKYPLLQFDVQRESCGEDAAHIGVFRSREAHPSDAEFKSTVHIAERNPEIFPPVLLPPEGNAYVVGCIISARAGIVQVVLSRGWIIQRRGSKAPGVAMLHSDKPVDLSLQ